ncbi:MAG TPA: hypothetical protein VNY51_14080 [Candidatus Dormibacteraeota bacterium]|jgi:hypothetical protein|nr:hypothetical protein [Candidatus Dormibacteraeota bacterium]
MNGTKSLSILEVIQFIRGIKEKNPGFPKDKIASATALRFNLKLSRKVYHCSDFAIRFSTAKGPSFSNTVLSLSALATYDKMPLIICIVRPKDVEFLLANATFLKKVSHSSHQLRIDNVKGSFLGHDIIRDFEGIRNCPSNFEKLFSIHGEFTWDENLIRLVEATTAIAPTGVRFDPSAAQISNIEAAPALASRISGCPEYLNIQKALSQIVELERDAILLAGETDNVNERGNSIEQIITRSGNVHGVQDLEFELPDAHLLVDVKTKLLNLASSPKGYNVDKFLTLLSTGTAALSFFFVGIDLAKHSISTRLVSVLDSAILKATRVQFHWAGRNSRGVTQLTGDLGGIFAPTFRETVSLAEAETFLRMLVNIRGGG